MNDHSTQEVRFISLRELPLNWKWMIGVGVFMLIFGTLGLLASSILTLTSVLMFGGGIFADCYRYVARICRVANWTTDCH